jgi:hypothetical protein
MVGETESAVPVEAQAGPDGAVLNLGDGVWQLQASAPGYWSQEAEAVVSRQAPASVRLAFWPAASLHGEVLTAAGEQPPHVVVVRLSAVLAPAGEMTTSQVPVLRPEPSPLRAELRCRINQGTWSCLGPAGLFDARLEVPGYAPRYEWGVRLKAAESANLGRTELHRGASVFGRAVRKDGSNPPGPCRAILQPDLERRGPPEPGAERAPVSQTSFAVPLTPRGYFQVLDVPPGRYLSAAECPAASSGLRELLVQTDTETRLDPPLLLEELTLDIIVSPKTDPQGRPWQLTVDATSPHLRRIAEATTSAEGRWTRRGLPAGNYRVAVSSSDGASWLQHYFDLGAGSGPLSLRLAWVKVAGRVLLGMQPVRARLVFYSEAGGEPTTLTSNDDGRFQGLLVVPPDVRETRWTVDAHVVQPPTNRRMVGVEVPLVAGGAAAWLDLALPTIAVRGSVVSEDGQPKSGVQVSFEDSGGGQTITSTDDAGNFDMPDLPAGKYTAMAESPEGASDRVPFSVAEGSERVLKLVLHSFERVPFYVVSNQGPVADAAVQVWISPGVTHSFTRTDQDGGFKVNLPPGTTEVGLTVGAPGYVLTLTRLQVSGDHTITLGASGSGTLVLDLQPPQHALNSSALDSSAMTPYLVHNGAIEDAALLAGWGTDQAGVSHEGPAVVQAIEPGAYALCLADPAALAALWQGTLSSDRCQKGKLEDGGTLTLSLP